MSTRGWSVTLPVTVSPSPLYTHCQMAQWTIFRTKQTSSAREAYLLLLGAHWPCKACLLLCFSKGRQTKLWKPSPNIIFKTPTSPIPTLVRERSQQLPGGFWRPPQESVTVVEYLPLKCGDTWGCSWKSHWDDLISNCVYFKLGMQTTQIICSPGETFCERTLESL